MKLFHKNELVKLFHKNELVKHVAQEPKLLIKTPEHKNEFKESYPNAISERK